MNKDLKSLLKLVVAIEVLAVFVTTCINSYFYFTEDRYWSWDIYPIMCGIVFGAIVLSVITAPILHWWMKNK